ncbi:MAG: hypothetical protein JWO02_4007 [Solirubrobacterales bacterium]|nr:hypothetical protein [Solirubrobacterales bacterium]
MTQLLPFVELEFVHAIGPAEGRYVVAIDGEAPAEGDTEAGTEDVLQIRIVEGTTTSKGLRRRTRDASGAERPADVPVLRVMWIGASQPADSTSLAAGRLDRLRHAEDEREELVDAVLNVLNTAVRAHRAAARDPYVAEVTRADPRAVRFGYGEARPLTQGQWSEAFLAPPPRAPRIDRAVRLGPSETVALALRGNLDLLESEELVLRGMLDVDQQRWRSAGAQLSTAVDLLRRELDAARERGVEVAVADEDLARRADRVRSLGELALRDELDVVAQGELRSHADALADALESWRAPP